jgi:hypothetical protein
MTDQMESGEPEGIGEVTEIVSHQLKRVFGGSTASAMPPHVEGDHPVLVAEPIDDGLPVARRPTHGVQEKNHLLAVTDV